jgi:hypothetical protein
VRYFFILASVVALTMTGWLFYLSVANAFEGIGIQRHWKPIARPYSAHVVAFADRGGVRVKTTAPVVEIRFLDGMVARFTSSRSGSLHLFRIGSKVSVLTDTDQLFERPRERYEIDSVFELWVKDVICALGIVIVVIGTPLWVYRPLRFRR